jgi:O-antigen/teichoic acid export membrane protein
MLSPFLAFLLMSVGALVAVALLLRRITVRFPSSQVLSFSELLHRHWNYGRWALGSSIATWLAGATYYFALSGFHGLPAAGELRALLNLSSPVGQGFAALSLLSLPYASRRYHEAGLAALKRLRFYLLALYAGGAATYFVIILGVRVPLLHFMYRDKYSGIVSLIPWLGLGMVLRIASTAQATLLRALQSPSQVFLAYGTAGAIALLIGLPLTWWEGLRGAVISGVLSSASAFVLTSVLVQRSFRAAVGVKSSICFQATA